MSLSPQYAKPRDIKQAANLLGSLGAGAMIIAGGQEILPSMNYGHLDLEVIVDVNGLNELRGIEIQGDELSIGALTVHRDLQASESVLSMAPLLAYAATQVGGGWQVQNRGTIGGNIVSMHPLYDIAPPLLAMGASVEICDASGTRRVLLADLIRDTKHGLGVSALLTRVFVPAMPASSGWNYQKLKTTHGAYGSANAAALLTVDARGDLTALAMAVGGAGDQPVVLTDLLADQLGSSALEPSTADEIDRRAVSAITQPLSDHQGHAEYRRAMAGVMAKRAFVAAARQTAAN